MQKSLGLDNFCPVSVPTKSKLLSLSELRSQQLWKIRVSMSLNNFDICSLGLNIETLKFSVFVSVSIETEVSVSKLQPWSRYSLQWPL